MQMKRNDCDDDENDGVVMAAAAKSFEHCTRIVCAEEASRTAIERRSHTFAQQRRIVKKKTENWVTMRRDRSVWSYQVLSFCICNESASFDSTVRDPVTRFYCHRE